MRLFNAGPTKSQRDNDNDDDDETSHRSLRMSHRNAEQAKGEEREREGNTVYDNNSGSMTRLMVPS